jgi:hypothetical protein
MKIEDLILPIDKALLVSELTPQKFVKNTNNANNEIYIFTHHDSPNLMLEIGRLRELTFRDAGGGTGRSMDIDEFDTMDSPFKQLIVWNPRDQEIVGGYRFLHLRYLKFDDHGHPMTPTAEIFKFSRKFIDEFQDKTIELGRSFVQPEYQPMYNLRKGMYSLDNIWDGLGAIISGNPDVEYFFGKFTMYTTFNQYARDLLLYFLNHYFPDSDKLVYPINPLGYHHDTADLAANFTGATYDENYKILNQLIRARKENIPALVNAYMNLSSTMRTFGTCINPFFGDVEETGIMICIPDIYDHKKERHLVIK